MRCVALASMFVLAGCAPAMPPAESHMHAGSPSATLAVTGAVASPLRVDVAGLQARPQVTVSVGGHAYTGAALWPLLQAAGIRGTTAKNPTVSMYLVATGSDGYQAVLSLAEIDPEFGAKPAIVATAMDGAALGRTGALRLIVPSDLKMARSVANLVRIDLVATGAAAR